MNAIRFALIVSVAVFLGALTVAWQKPAWYLRSMYPLKYPNTVITHAENYDVPPALLAAVIYQESGFKASARSKAGAIGLMQLTPRTARGIALHTGGKNFRHSDLRDPEINIRYGTWYLNHLHKKLDEPEGDYIMTLAAYNAGQGQVGKWRKADSDGVLTVEEIPFDETRSYVRRVLQIREFYGKAYPNLR